MQCESVQRDAVTYSANISASILDKIWYVNIINDIRSLEVLDFRKCDFTMGKPYFLSLGGTQEEYERFRKGSKRHLQSFKTSKERVPKMEPK